MKFIVKNFVILLGFIPVLVFCGYKTVDGPAPYRFPALKLFPEMPTNPENPVTVEGVELGRFLFYDPILSFDSTFSCSSCHQQESAFSDSPKRFSTGINGETMLRNTLPLFNLAWYPTLFWDGEVASIEEQVFHPVTAHDEMNLEWEIAVIRINRSGFYKPKFEAAFGPVNIDSTYIARAIAQFERTLLSHNSKYDKVIRGEAYFTQEEYEGFLLTNDQTKGDCLHCHITDGNALGTIAMFSNNGLEEVYDPILYKDQGKGGITGQLADIGLFKIPSLRNITLTAPYMHDGRFQTLEEVIDFYSEGVYNSYNIDAKMGSAHRGGVHLRQDEKDKVIAFLRTLTDSTFLSNPDFGNPFLPREE